MKVVEVDINYKPEPYDYPISFICGKHMMEKIGIIEPDEGIIMYLFKESEITKHGSDWLPYIPESHRISAMCLPDSISYETYIKGVYKSLESSNKAWDFQTLKEVSLEKEKK